MARVKAEYFNAKDKATGEIKEIQFIPPAPSDGDLGGISQEKLEQIDELKSDLVDLSNTVPEVRESDDTVSDLDITDSNGYVLARLKDGHIKTKLFDSSNIKSEAKVDSLSSDADADLDITDIAGNSVLRIKDGHIKTKYFDSLKINPRVVTVRQDGFGDFISLRQAVESIMDADAIYNPYVIEIHEGTYNICDEYTEEEILSAGEDHYTSTSFVGLKITSGISLRGIGCRDNVIIYGYLDSDKFTVNNRNNIATLNTQGECSLENLTIIGENVRYGVHDDFYDDFKARYGRNPKRILKNCVFVSNNTTGNASYGAGTTKARDFIIEGCAFLGGTCGIHTATGMHDSSTIIVSDCIGVGLSIGDYSKSSNDAMHSLIVNNNNFKILNVYKVNNDGYTGQHIKMSGAGGENTFCNVPSGFVYQTGDVQRVKKSIALGTVVNADYDVTSTDFYGVCIGSFENESYIQHSGYVKASLLGLEVSNGDYIGVTNGRLTVTTDRDASVGKVTSYGNGLYIKF